MKTLLPISFVILFSLGNLVGPAQAYGARQVPPASSSTSSASKKAKAAASPTSQDIADAKSKGQVWVNTSTHVYHNSSSSMYGTTKHGKFMAEDDAKKAGYRAAKESGAAQKQPGAKTPASK